MKASPPNKHSIYLCSLQELTHTQSKGIYLEDGRALLIVKRNESLFVYMNRCPHRLVYMESKPDQFLDASGHFIECSSHGALFEIDSGLCVSGPCIKQSLSRIDFSIDNDAIYISSAQA